MNQNSPAYVNIVVDNVLADNPSLNPTRKDYTSLKPVLVDYWKNHFASDSKLTFEYGRIVTKGILKNNKLKINGAVECVTEVNAEFHGTEQKKVATQLTNFIVQHFSGQKPLVSVKKNSQSITLK